MRYLGSKKKLSVAYGKLFSDLCATYRLAYYEPFCGSCSVAEEVKAKRRYCSDVNKGLITMWKAVIEGTHVFPTEVSANMYYKIRDERDMDNPDWAFVTYGCSFAGTGGTYARDKKGVEDPFVFPRRTKRSLDASKPRLEGVRFFVADAPAITRLPENRMVVYCDPPYEKTHGYHHAKDGRFDHTAFWEWVRKISIDHIVLVSEYQAPDDFVVVRSTAHSTTAARNVKVSDRTTTERLFMLRGKEVLLGKQS